jgi:hypothetical protein
MPRWREQVKLEDYLRHKDALEKKLADPLRRKLHIQYVGPSEHGGCHVTVFVMGTWFQHIWLSPEALQTPDLFAYTIESSMRMAVETLLAEAIKIEAPALREDLTKDIELRKTEEGNEEKAD